jgi:hypothetical protein
MPKRARKPARVREPLQVYLDPDERALLDRLARGAGLSRAEILRRGLQSFAVAQGGTSPQGRRSPMLEFMEWMARYDYPPDMSARHDDYLDEAYREGTREP